MITLLQKTDLDDFLSFLRREGYHYKLTPNHPKEFMRVYFRDKGYCPIFNNKKFPEAYTMSSDLLYLHEKFYGQRRFLQPLL